MIDFKFLNYITYDAFKRDLDDGLIRKDAIVFIQNRSRIWAHGKEYICDGPPDLSNYTTAEWVELTIRRMKDPVDSKIDENSAHAVENHAIAEALKDKADISSMSEYLTEGDIPELIAGKQDKLTPGYGIDITGDIIRTTLDSDVFIIVDELPTENINQNKIYITEETVEGVKKYYSYRWNGIEWIPMGEKAPTVNLLGYLKSADAEQIYQKIGNYAVQSDLTDLLNTIENTYQKKANYAQVGYVNQKLERLLEIINEQYVLKKDVYSPYNGEWSEADIIPMGDHDTIDTGGDNGNGGGNSQLTNKMVTLTTTAYQYLVDNNLVQSDTYYFTYEGEETNSWTFGGTFPITFGEISGLGAFPITLA